MTEMKTSIQMMPTIAPRPLSIYGVTSLDIIVAALLSRSGREPETSPRAVAKIFITLHNCAMRVRVTLRLGFV